MVKPLSGAVPSCLTCAPLHAKSSCAPQAPLYGSHIRTGLSAVSVFPACSGPMRSCWGVTQQMWFQLASKFQKTPDSKLCQEHGKNDLNVPVLPLEWGWPGFVPQAVQSLTIHKGRGDIHIGLSCIQRLPCRKCCSQGSVGWEGGVPAPPPLLCHMPVTPSPAQRNPARLSCMSGLKKSHQLCKPLSLIQHFDSNY